jgi:hypothetical protein
MKFAITFKDPDGVYESLRDAAAESVSSIEGVDDEERTALEEARQKKFQNFIEQWIRYFEHVTIEFDTEANTALVRRVS